MDWTRPTHRVPKATPQHEQVKTDCGIGVGPPATTTGAGFNAGSAPVVDNAAGAPGAAVLGAATGSANGDNVVTGGANPTVLAGRPEESGPIAEGISVVPAGTLLCARAREFRASAANAKPANAIIARAKDGTRRRRSSIRIFTDYCCPLGSQTSLILLDIIATQRELRKLCNRSFAGVAGRT